MRQHRIVAQRPFQRDPITCRWEPALIRLGTCIPALRILFNRGPTTARAVAMQTMLFRNSQRPASNLRGAIQDPSSFDPGTII